MKTNTTCLEPSLRTLLFVLLLSILCLVGMPRAGLADTYVSGTIAGQTWTAANSPYRVVGDINVALLTINPGVTVFFESNYVFEVDGFLTAIGTGAQPIIFACTNGGGWQGIFFNYCYDGSELAHCQIGNSVNSGIRCVSADPVIRSCVLANNSGSSGGGIYVDNHLYPGGDVAIMDCIFTNNVSANEGGGLYVRSDSSPSSGVVITNCSFTSNTAVVVGGAVSVHVGNTNASFANCTFAQNMLNSGGGSYGGAVAVYGNFSFDGCSFSQNKVYTSCGGYYCGTAAVGGGLYLSGNGSLRNCVFQGNLCQAGNGPYGSSSALGGGVAAYGNLLAQNCLFSFNTTSAGDPRGSGIHLGSGNSTIVNCTLAYNSNEGLRLDSGTATVLNSILFFNASGGTQIVGGPTVSYCDVQNGFPAGTNIIAFNPVFADTNSLMLIQGSRCIDAGNPSSAYNDSCFPPSLGTVRSDLGAYGGPGACCWNGPCAALEIRSEPVATTACVGGQATFGVGATGTQPITYQWFFYGTNSAGTPVPIAGATNATYTINNVQSTNAGWYSAQVWNPLGGLNSTLALLTVTPVCISVNLYMGLNITGGIPGHQYNILSTLSLTEPITWMTNTTFTQTAPGLLWIDTNSPANNPQKFYKVTQ
jgi:hypothetical protein